MICKHGDYKNGYIFTPSSCDEDLQKIFNQYNEVKCVICNKLTARNFRVFGRSIITINNKISDGCFFINHTY